MRILLGILLLALSANSYSFNHSLRGEQLPRVYDFKNKYSKPIQKQEEVKPVPVSEPETLILIGAGLILMIAFKRVEKNRRIS